MNELKQIVGAQKMPDGTMDYSKAAYIIERPSFKTDGLILVAEQLRQAQIEKTQKTSDERFRKSQEKMVSKFEGIEEILKSLENHQLATKDDAIALLQQWVEEMEAARAKEKDENEFDLLTLDIEKTENAIEFLKNTTERQIQTAENHEIQEAKMSSQKEAEIHRQQDFEQMDAVREKMFVAEILKQSGVAAFTSLPAEYSQRGSAGFSELVSKDRKNFNVYDFQNITSHLKDEEPKLKKEGVHEIITIKPYEVQKFTDVPEESRSWYGAKKTKMRVERTVVNPNHSEVFEGGREEEAYLFTYRTLDSDMSVYRDYSGRTGQTLLIEMVLPKTVALELQKKIEQNPHVVRELIEQTMTSKLGLNKEAWEKGNEKTNNVALRPPYQQWAYEIGGKSKMFIEGPDDTKVLEIR